MFPRSAHMTRKRFIAESYGRDLGGNALLTVRRLWAGCYRALRACSPDALHNDWPFGHCDLSPAKFCAAGTADDAHDIRPMPRIRNRGRPYQLYTLISESSF